MHAPPATEALDARRCAARAWLEMERAGVPPTPQNFDLWFTHLSGANLELTRQIGVLVDKQPVITPTALAALHANFPGPRIDLDEIVDRAEQIQQAAEAMVDEIVSNGEQLRAYGNTLSDWTTKLSQTQTLDQLLHAVTMLAVETARASERNRALDKQLSASSARITRLKDSMADLKREATTDVLTGLINRKGFNVRMKRALSEARTDAAPVSVLMLDVDHFKHVNDTYGHHTGDLVLRLIGRLLSDSVRGRDVSARYGGEEFAILLVGADITAAATVADKIRLALASKRLGKKQSAADLCSVTVSIGVAQFRPNDTLASLLNRADAAMYRAKQLGRNQVCTAPEDSDRKPIGADGDIVVRKWS